MSDKVMVQKETPSLELFEELLPLAKKCWTQSTADKGESCAYYGKREFEIQPDIDQYLHLQEHQSLLILTLREEGRLCGYVVGILYRCLHHKKILGCIADTIYIEPQYRGHTLLVVNRFEREAAALGVGIIGWPTHINGPVYTFLKAHGYIADDIVMEKLLCV